MRDRLIELLKRKSCEYAPCDGDCGECKNVEMFDDSIESIADSLLAAGVIVPPVAVGGNMYTLSRGRAKEWKVHFIGLNALGEIKFHLADKDFKHMIEAWDYDIGKTVFLARDEAEKAIAERSLHDKRQAD